MLRLIVFIRLLTFGWAMTAVLVAGAASGWAVEHTETLRASLGWRDNVMRSPFAPVSRPFARGEVEAFLSHSRRDWQFLSLLNGDVLRYFSPPADTGGEQQWFLHAEARWQHWPALRLGLKADAFFQDTVIDLSEIETVRTVLPARVHGVFATLAPHLELPFGFSFDPLGQVKQVRYRDIPGDYTETKTGARLAWSRSKALLLSAQYLEHRRRYDERQQFTAGGRPLKGTELRFWQREAEIRATTTWTGSGQWAVTAVLGGLENRDHGSGFFDYDQRHARLELTRQSGAWKVQLEGDAKRTDYLLQTVGTGIAPPPRIADAYETRCRVERILGLSWLVFAEHTWERGRSNERESSYRANTVLAGAQRDF